MACASKSLDDLGTRRSAPGATGDGNGSQQPQLDAGWMNPVVVPPGDSGAPPADVPAFEDPGCPSVPPEPPQLNCDPFSDAGSCGAGRGCLPYVQYPTAACERERYGTRCELAGAAGQGESCRAGCAPGYLCVASHRGSVCARLCELPGHASCPPGLLCSAVDIEGYGVCF